VAQRLESTSLRHPNLERQPRIADGIYGDVTLVVVLVRRGVGSVTAENSSPARPARLRDADLATSGLQKAEEERSDGERVELLTALTAAETRTPGPAAGVIAAWRAQDGRFARGAAAAGADLAGPDGER
jgi:hypothetical protein